ncbi:hypothetical protein T492DRAFT_605325, partial [Pavlovales sp. CCMP2436]
MAVAAAAASPSTFALPDGECTLVTPTGSRLEAFIGCGLAAREGLWRGADGACYLGRYTGGMRHGWSHFFAGAFARGRRSGAGIEVRVGAVYTGQWEDDLRNGYGTQHWCTVQGRPAAVSYPGQLAAKGPLRYEGEWRHGEVHGYGRHRW